MDIELDARTSLRFGLCNRFLKTAVKAGSGQGTTIREKENGKTCGRCSRFDFSKGL
jgi:hypothetical protein